MSEEMIEQEQQQQINEPKTSLDELLDRVLKETGKTRAEFEAEVVELRQQSNPEMMANLIAMVMMNVEGTAGMLSMIMMENAELRARIETLEGGTA